MPEGDALPLIPRGERMVMTRTLLGLAVVAVVCAAILALLAPDAGSPLGAGVGAYLGNAPGACTALFLAGAAAAVTTSLVSRSLEPFTVGALVIVVFAGLGYQGSFLL
jgi:hypothetical protein